MKALIFGAGGQDGYYLDALCRERGVECLGVSRSGDWIRGDISARDTVESLVKTHRPDFVFHLAAASTTRHGALWENHATIGTGTLNVLDAVHTYCPTTKVFIAGSGLQFHNTGEPLSENAPFAATSPYAVERIGSVYAARYYRTLGLKVYVGYLFHHDSPRRQESHVSQLIASAARRIGQDSDETLSIGDISVQKEWAFAGDIVNGMWTLVNQDEVFEAAIGTGEAHSIEEWLDQCFSLVGKNWREHVQLREGFVPEYSRLVSNPSTIRSLGWTPKVSFAELARLMVQGEGA